jgi:biotin transporter BioY
MHIVAIAWLYVALMMAITEKNITAGVLTFVFYGLAPCALVLWLGGTGLRHRARKRQSVTGQSQSGKQVHDPDGTDTGRDQ